MSERRFENLPSAMTIRDIPSEVREGMERVRYKNRRTLQAESIIAFEEHIKKEEEESNGN